MKKTFSTYIAVALLAASPVLASAAQGTAAASTTATTSRPRVHETRGTVKFIDAKRLVIVQPEPTRREVAFQLAPTVEVLGEAKIGSMVAVRYHKQAKQNVATGITVEHAKATPSTSGAHQ